MVDPVTPSALSPITAAIAAGIPHAATVPELLALAMRAHQEARVDDARLAYRTLLQRAPDHPDGLHLLGMLEGQFGSGTEALALLRKAVALYPQEAMFHNNLGNALLQAGLQDDAEAAYAQALALDPQRYDALNNRALILSRRGDLKGAEAAFLALLKVAPGFTEARQNLVHVCLRLGRVQDAMAHCVTGLVTAPHDRHLRGLLGRAYVQCKMPEKACEVYRQWIEEDPDDPVPRHHLAALEGRPPERASDDYGQLRPDPRPAGVPGTGSGGPRGAGTAGHARRSAAGAGRRLRHRPVRRAPGALRQAAGGRGPLAPHA
jgi:tetratricopeptide (TPR) repeat protein